MVRYKYYPSVNNDTINYSVSFSNGQWFEYQNPITNDSRPKIYYANIDDWVSSLPTPLLGRFEEIQNNKPAIRLQSPPTIASSRAATRQPARQSMSSSSSAQAAASNQQSPPTMSSSSSAQPTWASIAAISAQQARVTLKRKTIAPNVKHNSSKSSKNYNPQPINEEEFSVACQPLTFSEPPGKKYYAPTPYRPRINASAVSFNETESDSLFNYIRASYRTLQGINDTGNLSGIIDKLYGTDVKREPHSVEKVLEEDTDLQEWYTVAEMIRSYLDFYHDFDHNSFGIIIEPIMVDFENHILKYIKSRDVKDWYRTWKKRINTSRIFKGSGTVDQIVCRSLMSNMIDELLIKNHSKIPWIPLRQKDAVVETFPVRVQSHTYDVNKLYNALWERGIKSCFAESFADGFYDYLMSHNRELRQALHLKNRTMPIAKWDGGTGYTGINAANAELAEIKSPGDLDMFGGVITVSVNQDNNVLELMYNVEEKHLPIIRIDNTNKFLSLSLNRLLVTLGRSPYRGDQILDNSPLVIHPKPARNIDLSRLTLLKTWTDYMQTRALTRHYALRPKDLIGVVTVDICWNYTARMYGYPFVMLSTKTAVILYCYDPDAVTGYSQEITRQRITTFAKVLSLVDDGINITEQDIYKLANKWFLEKYDGMVQHQHTYNNPSLYLTIFYTKKLWETIRNRLNVEIERLLNIKKEIILGNPLSAENRQFIDLFPTDINKWFLRFVSAEDIIFGMYERIDKYRKYMTMIQGYRVESMKNRDFVAIDWKKRYDAIYDVVEAIPDIDRIQRQMTIVWILVMTYRNNRGGISALYPTLQFMLKRFVLDTQIISHNNRVLDIQEFVSANVMENFCLPTPSPSNVSINNLITLLRIAKLGKLIIPKDIAPRQYNLINAMDVYRVILRNSKISEFFENGLFTLWILSDKNCPYTCPEFIAEYRDIFESSPADIELDNLATCFIEMIPADVVTYSIDDQLKDRKRQSRISKKYSSKEQIKSLLSFTIANDSDASFSAPIAVNHSAAAAPSSAMNAVNQKAAATNQNAESMGGTRNRSLRLIKKYSLKKRRYIKIRKTRKRL
uniref:Uncharacterized protein n=1 Tax=viral metagenome TaxID=1070528 RepID=A0A6C0KTY6_9ZZZZ